MKLGFGREARTGPLRVRPRLLVRNVDRPRRGKWNLFELTLQVPRTVAPSPKERCGAALFDETQPVGVGDGIDADIECRNVLLRAWELVVPSEGDCIGIRDEGCRSG